MNQKIYFLFLLLLLFFTCTIPQAPPLFPPKNPHLQAFTADYVQAFQTILNQTKTPGAGLVIVKDTTVLHLSGHGEKAAFSNDSVDINTVFRIGSLSKGFAAVLAGILVEKGALKWTDKVNQYIPEFILKDSVQSGRVNLIHLLSQSSGLPYHAYTNLVEAGLDMRQIARELKKVNLIGKEGEIYAYQNASYSLIGEIMEVVQKESLPQIFEEELLHPLQIENTSTEYEAFIQADNIALPHRGGNGNWSQRPISKKYYNAIPAGGVNASIADMGEWLQLLLGNRPEIIQQKTLNEIFKPRINTNNKNRYFHDWPMVEDAFYGLGWRILTNAQDTLIYHGGFVNGYRGEILIHPKEKLGICVLVNAPSKLANRAIPLFLEQYELKRDSVHAWEKRLEDNQDMKNSGMDKL